MKKTYKKRSGISIVIYMLNIMALLCFAGLVIDVANILASQNELQKITETVALVGASNMEVTRASATTVGINTTQIEPIMRTAFTQMVQSNAFISGATMGVPQINNTSKAVLVSTTARTRTYFLGLAGIINVNINAQAAAMSAPFYLSDKFPRFPRGSIIDSDIRVPQGGLNNSQNLGTGVNPNIANYLTRLYGFSDYRAVSLGPGGYVTIRLPVPLENGPGFDLFISELGNRDGYFVFAGIDADPLTPFSSGGTIRWVNISCTGTPVGVTLNNNATNRVASYLTPVSLSGSSYMMPKFYGSGFFDIGRNCSDSTGAQIYNGTQVNSARYIRIIDDGVEDGFVAGSPASPVLIPGEHAGATPGADIDAVGVLNHTRLIRPSQYNIDSDGDGLINILENELGFNPNNAFSDGGGINDGLEYAGFTAAGMAAATIVNSPASVLFYTSPSVTDTSRSDQTQDVIFP